MEPGYINNLYKMSSQSAMTRSFRDRMKKEPVKSGETPSILPAIGILFRAALFVATFATIVPLLVRYGERSRSVVNDTCRS